MNQILFWVILIMATLLAFWACMGTDTIKQLEGDGIVTNVICVLLGAHLVLKHGYYIVQAIMSK